ncbi:hypothetical protein GCM10010299_22220 [Streptomyces tanashiensis]|nr:hypothetical protein GCM10010299_22220 [Streptomyces tanashiensis]
MVGKRCVRCGVPRYVLFRTVLAALARIGDYRPAVPVFTMLLSPPRVGKELRLSPSGLAPW